MNFHIVAATFRLRNLLYNMRLDSQAEACAYIKAGFWHSLFNVREFHLTGKAHLRQSPFYVAVLLRRMNFSGLCCPPEFQRMRTSNLALSCERTKTISGVK